MTNEIVLPELITGHVSLVTSEWTNGLRLWNFVAAVLTRPTSVISPKILHCLAEMLDDVGAIEVDIFHERAAIVAVENHVFVFAWWASSLNDHTNRVRRPNRRMRNIRRNKKRFPLAHEVIDDLVALADSHLDVAFELIKIFLGVDLMEIVPGIGALDHHHEKIAPIVKISIADRRLE